MRWEFGLVLLVVLTPQAAGIKESSSRSDLALKPTEAVRSVSLVDLLKASALSKSSGLELQRYRSKRSVFLHSGVRICPQETLNEILASHRAYYQLRVCQEAVWEAFRIFFDRIPGTSEYKKWVHTCQHESLCISDLARNFSSSEEHMNMINRRLSRRRDGKFPSRGVLFPTTPAATTVAQKVPDIPVTQVVTTAAEVQTDAPPAAQTIPPTITSVLPSPASASPSPDLDQTQPAEEVKEDLELPNVLPESLMEHIVEFSIDLVDPGYRELLDNPEDTESPQYIDLAHHLQDQMLPVFDKLQGFKGLRVRRISETADTDGLGGITVHYSLLFENNIAKISAETTSAPDASASSVLKGMVRKALREDASLPIDLDSLTFEREDTLLPALTSTTSLNVPEEPEVSPDEPLVVEEEITLVTVSDPSSLQDHKMTVETAEGSDPPSASEDITDESEAIYESHPEPSKEDQEEEEEELPIITHEIETIHHDNTGELVRHYIPTPRETVELETEAPSVSSSPNLISEEDLKPVDQDSEDLSLNFVTASTVNLLATAPPEEDLGIAITGQSPPDHEEEVNVLPDEDLDVPETYEAAEIQVTEAPDVPETDADLPEDQGGVAESEEVTLEVAEDVEEVTQPDEEEEEPEDIGEDLEPEEEEVLEPEGLETTQDEGEDLEPEEDEDEEVEEDLEPAEDIAEEEEEVPEIDEEDEAEVSEPEEDLAEEEEEPDVSETNEEDEGIVLEEEVAEVDEVGEVSEPEVEAEISEPEEELVVAVSEPDDAEMAESEVDEVPESEKPEPEVEPVEVETVTDHGEEVLLQEKETVEVTEEAKGESEEEIVEVSHVGPELEKGDEVSEQVPEAEDVSEIEEGEEIAPEVSKEEPEVVEGTVPEVEEVEVDEEPVDVEEPEDEVQEEVVEAVDEALTLEPEAVPEQDVPETGDEIAEAEESVEVEVVEAAPELEGEEEPEEDAVEIETLLPAETQTEAAVVFEEEEIAETPEDVKGPEEEADNVVLAEELPGVSELPPEEELVLDTTELSPEEPIVKLLEPEPEEDVTEPPAHAVTILQPLDDEEELHFGEDTVQVDEEFEYLPPVEPDSPQPHEEDNLTVVPVDVQPPEEEEHDEYPIIDLTEEEEEEEEEGEGEGGQVESDSVTTIETSESDLTPEETSDTAEVTAPDEPETSEDAEVAEELPEETQESDSSPETDSGVTEEPVSDVFSIPPTISADVSAPIPSIDSGLFEVAEDTSEDEIKELEAEPEQSEPSVVIIDEELEKAVQKGLESQTGPPAPPEDIVDETVRDLAEELDKMDIPATDPSQMMEEGSSFLPLEEDLATVGSTALPPIRYVTTATMTTAGPGKELVVFFSLRVTNMDFSEDLFNKTSPEYRNLENRFLHLLLPYLQANLTGFMDLEILNFRKGSVVVNSKMKFAKTVPYNVTQAVHCVLEEFCTAASKNLHIQIDKGSLDIEPADLADPCKFLACDEFSHCVVNRRTKEAQCVCQPGYRSVDGLPCQSECVLQPDYCRGGECHILPGRGAMCRYKDSYFLPGLAS